MQHNNNAFVFDIDGHQANALLKKPGEWLVRNSQTAPGLLTVSGCFVGKQSNMQFHMRFGLTPDGWQAAPMPPTPPKVSDTAEVKARYSDKKVEFENHLKLFTDQSNALFKEGMADKFRDQFLQIIQSATNQAFGVTLSIDTLVLPKPEQKSLLSGYNSYSFEDITDAKEIFSKNISPRSISDKG